MFGHAFEELLLRSGRPAMCVTCWKQLAEHAPQTD